MKHSVCEDGWEAWLWQTITLHNQFSAALFTWLIQFKMETRSRFCVVYILNYLFKFWRRCVILYICKKKKKTEPSFAWWCNESITFSFQWKQSSLIQGGNKFTPCTGRLPACSNFIPSHTNHTNVLQRQKSGTERQQCKDDLFLASTPTATDGVLIKYVHIPEQKNTERSVSILLTSFQ